MFYKPYEKLSIEEFGRNLLETGDLDPVYVMLYEARKNGLNDVVLKRWLLAYWCYYHAGVASFIAEKPAAAYWEYMMTAAKNDRKFKTWPRGEERRHFRGQKAVNSIALLRARYPSVDSLFDELTTDATDYPTVIERTKKLYGFGNWIGFKIADMLEQVLEAPLDPETCDVSIYDVPRKGAELWFSTLSSKARAYVGAENALAYAIDQLRGFFGSYAAPPHGLRLVSVPEIETILCKWKSHVNGAYPLGKDSKELSKALTGWGTLAERLRDWVPGEKEE